jgi:hypothetical protein
LSRADKVVDALQCWAVTFQFAKRTPFNIAPERGRELASEIFAKARWQLTTMDGSANFHAYPNETRVAATHAGLASLWCVSYAAFHISDVASRSQRGVDKAATHIDIGDHYAKMQIGEHLDYACCLFRSDLEWPTNIEPPEINSKFETSEWRVNNLFFGALSWVLLHEIGHVHLKHEKDIPVRQRLRQEFQADNFATCWILDEAGSGIEREFRVLVVCVALSWLFLNEKTLGQGSDHPAAIIRFQEATGIFEMGERSAGLENAAYVLKAIFDPKTNAPAFETPKQSFDWIGGRLTKLFPR